MKLEKTIDAQELFAKVLGDKMNQFDLPQPSFKIMQCEIIAFDEVAKTLTIKMPILKQWLNAYGMMQGGMIVAGVDNAVGPLSLFFPTSLTRTIETKYISSIAMELETIYVRAFLLEEKKKRLTFGVSVEDDKGKVYATARVVNFILKK